MESTLKVAAITTIYYAHSHADAIVTKFMKGTSTDEGFFPPEVELVSLYIDHVLENDIGVELAREHGVPVYPSIRRALHAGGLELRVDAVLLIGEHGDYPWNERGRHMYPRRYFFEQIAGVFAESGRSVPVYNDKHFAYDFQDALWMWNRARELVRFRSWRDRACLWPGANRGWNMRRARRSKRRYPSDTAALSRRTGTTLSRCCCAWWNDVSAARWGYRRCSASKETRSGRRAIRVGGPVSS